MAGMMPKSGKHAYDLWDKTNSKPKKKAKSIAVPTGKLALDGTVPVETVPVANPLFRQWILFSMLLLSRLQPYKKQLKARKHAQLISPRTVALKVAHPGQSCRPDIV
jgi:hypothetical protein